MSCRSSFSPEVTCSTCLWVIFFLKWWGVHLQVKYYIHMEWSLSVFSLAEQQMEDRMEWMMNKLTTRRSCYSVWVRMMMRRMTTTTAQTAPIMIIFYREGETEGDEGRIALITGNMSTEVSPLTKHRLKQCATNPPLTLLCLFSVGLDDMAKKLSQ